MSICENVIKKIEEKSESFYGLAELYNLYELHISLRKYYIISERIKVLLGKSVKIDRKLFIDNFIKEKEKSFDFFKEYKDNIYSYRVKDYNIWISEIFIKNLTRINDIVSDELFKL